MVDEILFMQIRLVDCASKKWHKSIKETSQIFKKYDVYRFIRRCYGIFHTEGDEAVMYDIQNHINKIGGLDAAI